MTRILMMKLLCVVLMLFSSAIRAKEPTWLRAVVNAETPWILTTLRQQTDLYDCGLKRDDEFFCSEPTLYYQSQLSARLEVKQNKVNRMQLSHSFDVNSYSQWILNLRKDGYQLIKVDIAGSIFDVTQQLETGKNSNAIDKALVSFLNSQPLSAPRTLIWNKVKSTNTMSAQLKSDGTELTLLFQYR